VARIQPPYRARLDLFGPRGEGYVSAAVVAGELRLPPGVSVEDVPLPPPALMWSVLGVVAPPATATLEGTRVQDERTELHYAVEADRLVYVLEGGALRSVEWVADRRQSVGLDAQAELRIPRRATYRDWKGNTELMLILESVEPTGPYPGEVWTPDA
jgi:hypothetical protein